MAADQGRAGPGLDTQVVVAGAGPVGLLLAAELRLGGADVVVVERRETPTTESRASTLHARTMEILDSRGLLDGLGMPPNVPMGHFGGIPMDLSMPSRYPGQWKVPQTRTERLLQDRALELGADIRRGWELTDLADEGGHVTVTARTPQGVRRLTCVYLVACDGETSTVRHLTGVGVSGRPARRELLRADVAGVEIRGRRFERLEEGLAIASRNAEGVTRVMVHAYGRPVRPHGGAPEFDEVVEVWKRVTGEDLSTGEPLWVNAFDDANRQVDSYRLGRVLFAGDAAHQQMPSGGQALNLGLQDAFNLGWKLALAVGPRPPEGLLDTYHDERHPVGARILANIRTQGLLLLGDEEVEPVRDLLAEFVAVNHNRERLAGMISGLDVAYPLGDGEHPLLGRRLPEIELTGEDGPVTGAEVLRSGRGVLLDLSDGRDPHLSWIARLWDDRVTTVTAEPGGAGPFEGARAALVRPDGHVAWVCSGRDTVQVMISRWLGMTDQTPYDGLRAALRRWFGPPRAGL